MEDPLTATAAEWQELRSAFAATGLTTEQHGAITLLQNHFAGMYAAARALLDTYSSLGTKGNAEYLTKNGWEKVINACRTVDTDGDPTGSWTQDQEDAWKALQAGSYVFGGITAAEQDEVQALLNAYVEAHFSGYTTAVWSSGYNTSAIKTAQGATLAAAISELDSSGLTAGHLASLDSLKDNAALFGTDFLENLLSTNESGVNNSNSLITGASLTDKQRTQLALFGYSASRSGAMGLFGTVAYNAYVEVYAATRGAAEVTTEMEAAFGQLGFYVTGKNSHLLTYEIDRKVVGNTLLNGYLAKKNLVETYGANDPAAPSWPLATSTSRPATSTSTGSSSPG